MGYAVGGGTCTVDYLVQSKCRRRRILSEMYIFRRKYEMFCTNRWDPILPESSRNGQIYGVREPHASLNIWFWPDASAMGFPRVITCFQTPSGVFYISERIDVAFEAILDSLIIYYVGPPAIIEGIFNEFWLTQKQFWTRSTRLWGVSRGEEGTSSP